MSCRLPLLASALLALSCAGAQTVNLPLSPRRFSSSWRPTKRPRVNLTRRADGTWAGNLLGKNYILTPGEGSLRGSGADLHFVRWDKEIAVLGTLSGIKIRIRIVPGEGLRSPDGKVCRAEGGGDLVVDCRPEEARASLTEGRHGPGPLSSGRTAVEPRRSPGA